MRSGVDSLTLPGPWYFRESSAWSHLANSSKDLAGGGLRSLARGDPKVNDSWNWTPATLGFSSSQVAPSLFYP